jgi:hypothetical protein
MGNGHCRVLRAAGMSPWLFEFREVDWQGLASRSNAD